MISLKLQDHGIIELLNQDYLQVLAELFLIDRKSQGLSPETIRFYEKKLNYFLKHCEGNLLRPIKTYKLPACMVR